MSGSLLDTSAVLDAPDGTLDHPDTVAVSVVTLGELHAGVLRARDEHERRRRERSLEAIHELFVPVDVDVAVAERFGEVLAHARAQRRTAKSTDLLIVAAASATDRTLVTRDRRQAALAHSFGVEVQLAA